MVKRDQDPIESLIRSKGLEPKDFPDDVERGNELLFAMDSAEGVYTYKRASEAYQCWHYDFVQHLDFLRK